MWKPGPLPPNTWHWGAVVTKEYPATEELTGFRFADFKGDHAELLDGTKVPPEMVRYYNNSITWPINAPEDKDFPDCKVS